MSTSSRPSSQERFSDATYCSTPAFRRDSESSSRLNLRGGRADRQGEAEREGGVQHEKSGKKDEEEEKQGQEGKEEKLQVLAQARSLSLPARRHLPRIIDVKGSVL